MATVDAEATHQVFYCHCPLKCKGTSRLGMFFTYEEASEKVLWHLEKSEKHYMKEGEAAECLVDNVDCIWEETVKEKDLPQQQKQGTADKRARSSGSGHSTAQAKSAGSSSWRDGRGRRPELRDRSRSRDARASSSLALRPSVAEVTEQKQAVYNFARVLGKCEAVIRTAARVARQASSAFEVDLACLTSSPRHCFQN